jgi:hypothetical protein
MVALVLAAGLPAAALAAPPAHWMPRGWGRIARSMGPMVLSGAVAEVGENELVVELEHRGQGRRWIRHEITLAVDEESLLFANDLTPLALADLQEGDVVLVAPRLAWGAPAVQLLYAGGADELADHTFRGRVESVDGDTLVLTQGRGEQEELTVIVDAETVWLDHGRQGRPDELPEGLPLRVLGTEQEDGTVQAALITAGRFGL